VKSDNAVIKLDEAKSDTDKSEPVKAKPETAKADAEPDKAAPDYEKLLTAWKANKKARDEAWVRWKKLLAAI